VVANPDGVELVWSGATCDVHRFVVGPIDNNVYVVRCRDSGQAVLIDAANEHDRLLRVAQRLGVTMVLETHGHWDHIGAVAAVREAGIDVRVRTEDAARLPSYDALLDDDDVITVGSVRLRTVHTPGHTPGSICFALEGTPVLFTGDTLFPGGPGNTSFAGGDFATIIRSIEDRLFAPYGAETVIWPGHGSPSTLGVESPHLDEWVERGW
jgi:glyoxylase-like metal-dependent hydrolase (beta-lactamase superfamily II)